MRLGRHPEFCCIARLIRPFRYPNSVPVVLDPDRFRPPMAETLCSHNEGSLHWGLNMGRDRQRENVRSLLQWNLRRRLGGLMRVYKGRGAGGEREEQEAADTLGRGLRRVVSMGK